MIGEYRPLDQASDEDIAALFAGHLRDNTDSVWTIEQSDAWVEPGFTVHGPGAAPFRVREIALPVPVENYRLSADQSVIDQIYRGAAALTAT